MIWSDSRGQTIKNGRETFLHSSTILIEDDKTSIQFPSFKMNNENMWFTDESLCFQIASSLNQAGVPCALWGYYAQIVCGSYEDVRRKVSLEVVELSGAY